MIENDQEFEAKLAQLCRLYRAQRALWTGTDSTDQAAVAKWVVDAGKILDLLTPVLGDIEDYSGCMELRLIVDALKTKRLQREQENNQKNE